MNAGKLRVNFVACWLAVLAAKLWLAASLPLFVDEAFYAWESRYPALAYSDLPGLTAWLASLGLAVGGNTVLALRLPFLLVGSAIPWIAVGISRRWFGDRAGWWAGLLAVAMPLSGLLGVLALPDVPLVFAAMLALLAIVMLRERIGWRAVALLAAALVIGAFSHYRFALVVAAGLVGLLCDRVGRKLLTNARVWLALAVGLAAWFPLLQWNLQHGSAGVRFQLLERNPWAFHADAAAWLPIQILLVTPPLFVLLVLTWREAIARRSVAEEPWGLLLGLATVSVWGYFLLGFFADSDRVSFHWPLSGWLALVVAAPAVMLRWRPSKRALVVVVAATGLLATIGYLVAASNPDWRRSVAGSRFYPGEFSGWKEVADAVAQQQGDGSSAIVAGDFELAAQLAFALQRPDVQVLDDRLNRKHGRAAQLQAWGLQLDDVSVARREPALLVIDDSATPLKDRLAAYHRVCALFGSLPRPAVVTVDRGRKRYFIYSTIPGAHDTDASCAAPALAWIDSPSPRQRVARKFEVKGWAFKDGVGLTGVEVTLDGKAMSRAAYGLSMPDVANYWRISNDPNQPRVGFSAPVDASGFAPGKHWLGLVLHASDGSSETWPEQEIQLGAY